MRTLMFLLLVPFLAQAETVINYDDGSTYTLELNQDIYISNKGVYTVKGDVQNWLSIKRLTPWSKRDYVPEALTGDELCWVWAGVAPPPGYSHEACFDQEEPVEEVECDPSGLSFGGGC